MKTMRTIVTGALGAAGAMMYPQLDRNKELLEKW